MKRLLTLCALLFLSAVGYAAETGYGQLAASCVAVSTTGACVTFNVHPPDFVHIPQANSFTWQTIFAGGTPTSITVVLQGSIDGTTFSTIDTSTSTAGETRSKTGTAYNYFRCNVTAYSPNGTTLGCQITPSFSTGGGGTGAVDSVNGQTGTVVLAATDVGAAATSHVHSAADVTSGLLAVARGGTGTASPGIIAGTNITVSGSFPTQTVNATAGGAGTVTSFSAGTLSPLFTTSVATATSTPALTFSLSTAAAHSFFGNNTGSTAAPGFQAIAEGDVTSLTTDLGLKANTASPTFTGTVTLPASTTLVTPILGTPTSVTLTNATGLPESGVTSLTSDLALKAPLASPALTGVPTAPTASVATNTTQLATTAFVLANQASPSGTVAIKPVGGDPGEGICYATANGNDSNDGLSWGSAKATIYGCLIALPAGHSSAPATAGRGTVYISGGATNAAVEGGLVSSGSSAGTGIWLMGPTDPNYASPPNGWLRQSGPLNFVGVSGSGSFPASSHVNGPSIKAGAYGDQAVALHPSVWLSNVLNISFQNLNFYPANKTIEASMNSAGASADSGGATNIVFRNVGMTLSNNSAAVSGPNVDIGPNSFWWWFYDCTFSGNLAATLGTDQSEAIVLNAHSLTNNVLFYVYDSTANNGAGIKLNDSGNADSIYVKNFSIEGRVVGSGNPGVWFAGGSQSSQGTIEGVVLADYVDPVPAVRVDGNSPQDAVLVTGASGSGGVNVQGPATVLGQNQAGGVVLTTSPLAQHQAGFFSGGGSQLASRVLGQVDVSRRAFGPVSVRYPNVAVTSPASWVIDSGSTPTITTGIAAPDGTTGAGQIAAAGSTNVKVYRVNQTIGAGDIIIGGVWARSQTANGFSGNNPATIFLTGTVTTSGQGILQQRMIGDGEWIWLSGLVKVLTQSGGTHEVIFDLKADATHTAQFYAPILYILPSATVSDNEAYELLNNLQPYASTCTAGQLCTMAGVVGSGGGTGTVTTFSAGNLAPLFTSSVATATTTPALTFALSNFAAHTFFGNNTAGSAAPGAQAIGEADVTNLTSDLALKAPLLSPSFTTPNLGTPSAGVLTNVTGLPLTTGVTGVLPMANMAQSFVVNAQTATYQVLAADFIACKTIPVASGTFTITLVASGTQPASGQCIDIVNYGSGVVTVARSGQNINGAAANLTIAAGSASAPLGLHVVSDGTNYVAQTWGAGSGGSGTVTATGGALTSNAVVLGAGTTDTKVSTGITTNGVAELDIGVAGTNGVLGLKGTTSGTATWTAPAVAGTTTNAITSSNVIAGPDGSAGHPTFCFTTGSCATGIMPLVGSAGTELAFVANTGVGAAMTSNGVFVAKPAGVWGFTDTNGNVGLSLDLGISRGAAGVLDVGNGSSGNTTAAVKASSYMSVGTKFTASGCTNGTTVGGATAGSLLTGAGGACTITITMGDTATAPNGWACSASDFTTAAGNPIYQSANSTTTAALTLPAGNVSGDKIVFHCMGY